MKNIGRNFLRMKLKKIERVFNIQDILNSGTHAPEIQKYYKTNQLSYSIFHTAKGFFHMAISRDGVYKSDDLYEAPRMVDGYIKKLNATNVLELATGRGSNSVYLAEKNPETYFIGVDFSEAQLTRALRRSKEFKNYKPQLGDFHDLSLFTEESFDVVFIIEALCHSDRKEKVLAEVYRVLKPNGVFIIFDGYRDKDFNVLTEDEKTGVLITEKAMAVPSFAQYENFKESIIKTGFSIEKDEDVSQFVLPNMYRFEWLARGFFKFPVLAKFINKILPKEFTYNAIAGYLMPILVQSGVFSYRIFVGRRG